MPIEVMWPRLIVNKILRRRWDSSNFVADFPYSSEDSPSEIQSSDQEPLSPKSVFEDVKNTKKYKVFVSTWNVGGVAPPDTLDMDVWLDRHNNPCDIYVFGFQEIVPLNTGNVLGAEKNRISMKWNSLIRAALHKNTNTSAQPQNQKNKFYSIKGGSSMNSNVPMGFQCIISKNMVGILICVWVKSELRQYIQHPSVSCVGCGIMGCLGNKGAVSVRFCLHETSFCFVCGHLASGGKEGDEKHRNSDVAEILSRTSFPRGPLYILPPKILDHDRVVFLGDLNYRISLSEATTRSLVENKEWNTLLENDQLRVELMEGKIFEGWQEGPIKFSPTYKYYPNSDAYYGCDQSKKGEKRRSPAWCDRIIWFGKGLKQKKYDRGESRLSDHRPVWAIFTVEVNTSREFKNCFLSDRFERRRSFEAFSSCDEFFCSGRASFRF
ncbi:Type i inositol polyphosphate 5-phosphatase protein [Thalictrum thalictroides]|uniref:Type i inositol polyphosphate 5-phosphatase protein n=1 Tax=Thalictrum thalictroides TaxID=46969 RepID=A0A7J6XB55_THATH|nr:Type i inositol polyphosphate 5-phosphatase protein [Thalictrum thalictroides]